MPDSESSPPAPDTCLLFLLRHGATENNVADPPRLQGRRSNLGLSPDGRRQSADAARQLATRQIAAVYSSPLLRALETAETIAAPQALAVQIVEALVECDVGEWEGRSWVEIERTEPEAHRLFRENPGEHGYRGGENLAQVRDRVVPAFEAMMRENLGRSIVAVAHNVVNRCYLASLLGLSLAGGRGVPQENCGINLIRYRQGGAKAITVNSVFHLRDWA